MFKALEYILQELLGFVIFIVVLLIKNFLFIVKLGWSFDHWPFSLPIIFESILILIQKVLLKLISANLLTRGEYFHYSEQNLMMVVVRVYAFGAVQGLLVTSTRHYIVCNGRPMTSLSNPMRPLIHFLLHDNLSIYVLIQPILIGTISEFDQGVSKRRWLLTWVDFLSCWPRNTSYSFNAYLPRPLIFLLSLPIAVFYRVRLFLIGHVWSLYATITWTALS